MFETARVSRWRDATRLLTSTRSVIHRPLAVLSGRYAPLWPVLSIGVLVAFWLLLPIPATADAENYWMADLGNLYRWAWGGPDAYVYSPAFAQLIAPLTALPYDAFYRVVLAVNLGCLWWLIGPWSALALLLPPVAGELGNGQIHLPLAVATVAMLRYPGAWAFLALTKVTPGVTILWWVARREWQQAGTALGVTVLITAASALLLPEAWIEWIGLLGGSSTHHIVGYTVSEWPVVFRLPIAAGLTIMAGWRDRPAALPVIACFALPSIWFGALAMLLAAITRLRRAGSFDRKQGERRTPGAVGSVARRSP